MSLTLNQGKSLAAAVSQVELSEKLQEAFKAQRAIADYIELLLRQVPSSSNTSEFPRPHAVGGERK